MEEVTPEDIARWMLKRIENGEELYQQDVVYEISQKFGEKFVYDNERGNPAIDKKVLKAFREVSEDTVVWEKGMRMWRKREVYDDPGRGQQ
ncbi:hypothetical protein F8568_013270 [Actinomadura sp. LD22]|uniref:Uncharacterized protein n=1 Tax=Actinomadura physcomitrii TaxID=2650748 RepID=A0A6I4MBF9_9ACTN|nr:hypothetical protein [Actinomadura physcomitrii]MWA01337.1 hypothetical protein [Actinomadura physcomitrii]